MKRDRHNHVHSDNGCTVSGSSSTEPPVKGPPPPIETTAQGNPPPQEPAQVVVPAPINDSVIVRSSSPAGAYTLKATSGLPSGCAELDGFNVERVGDSFRVEVTILMPRPSLIVACTSIYGYSESEISLGSGLIVGETYTVTINEDITISFTPQEDVALHMVEKESPIENAEVAETDGGYLLTVASRLPMGSSCSRFNGYEINRRFADRIEATVTHVEVAAENVPCTADPPVFVAYIPLGDDFEGGRNYSVFVNGEEYIFTTK